MAWWIFVVAGIVFMFFETLLPLDFFFFFVGVAAILTGIIEALDIVEIISNISGLSVISTQLVLFTVALCVLYFGCKKPLIKLFNRNIEEYNDGLVGMKVKILEDIEAGAEGRAEARGTTWEVRNQSAGKLSAGSEVKVAEADGKLLVIK